MSKIAEYFEAAQKSGKTDDKILSDSFFSLYQEMIRLRSRLDKIRREQLDCCGARLGSKGAAELLIVDQARFESLNMEYAAAEARIRETDAYLAQFDPIAVKAAELGLKCAATPHGLDYARVEVSNEHFKLRRKIDSTTKNLIDRRIPAGEVGVHPQIVDLEIAMAEQQKKMESIEGLLVAAKKAAAC